MDLKEVLYTEVIPRIKQKDRSTIIGEGTQGEIYGRFICKSHRDMCIKVFYPNGELARDEFIVLTYAHKLGLSVPKPIEVFEDANAFGMGRIAGFNLEEIIRKNFKVSAEVTEQFIDVVNEVCTVINHNDLSLRNVMLGDIEFERGIIIDAIPYVIDFGHSTIKTNKSRSDEGLNVIKAIKKITSLEQTN